MRTRLPCNGWSSGAGIRRCPNPGGHYVRVEEAIRILRVSDAETSVAWYERLGYEKEWENRFEPSLPAFVSLARNGTSRLFLSEHSADAGGPLVAGTVVYIRVGDVDGIAKQFDTEIVERPWAREVFLTDPDGNRLRIGTPKYIVADPRSAQAQRTRIPNVTGWASPGAPDRHV
jgi:catechol 2,3-dioxygenase-like lactoylglutathione lyase family enzyme